MPKLKLSKDVRDLNPILGNISSINVVSIQKEPTADKAQLFEDAWIQYFGKNGVGMYDREYLFNKPYSKHRFDFAFTWYRDHKVSLAIEIDGGEWMPFGGRHSHDADRIKLNIAAEKGWRIMRFSPAMLEIDPNGCILQVIRALNYGSK